MSDIAYNFVLYSVQYVFYFEWKYTITEKFSILLGEPRYEIAMTVFVTFQGSETNLEKD